MQNLVAPFTRSIFRIWRGINRTTVPRCIATSATRRTVPFSLRPTCTTLKNPLFIDERAQRRHQRRKFTDWNMKPFKTSALDTLPTEWLYVVFGFFLGAFVTVGISTAMYWTNIKNAMVLSIPNSKNEDDKKRSANEKDQDKDKEASKVPTTQTIPNPTSPEWMIWLKNNFPVETALQMVGSAVVMSCTFLFLRNRAAAQWKKRQFLSRVNFAYHFIDKRSGKLEVRTLFEKDLAPILLDNKTAISLVLSAANKTTLEQPFLSFHSKDGWVILNAILNVISGSIHPLGFLLAHSDGVVHKWYCFGIAHEKNPELYQKKLRVVIVEEETLRQIADGKVNPPVCDNAFLKVRWNTLHSMGEYLKANQSVPTRGASKTLTEHSELRLGKVELVLPKLDNLSDYISALPSEANQQIPSC